MGAPVTPNLQDNKRRASPHPKRVHFQSEVNAAPVAPITPQPVQSERGQTRVGALGKKAETLTLTSLSAPPKEAALSLGAPAGPAKSPSPSRRAVLRESKGQRTSGRR